MATLLDGTKVLLGYHYHYINVLGTPIKLRWEDLSDAEVLHLIPQDWRVIDHMQRFGRLTQTMINLHTITWEL